MRKNIMLGTALNGQGGIASVISVYREMGFLERNNVYYIATHCEGSALKKVSTLLRGFVLFLWMLLIGKVGLVHIHTASNMSFWRKSFFILAAKLVQRPVIPHIHGGGFRTFFEMQSKFKKKYLKYILYQTDTIIVLSESWKSWLEEVVKHRKIVPIYNPVQVPEKKNGKVTKPFSVLFLGKLGKNKGIYDLLDAIVLIKDKYPSLKILLGGDGEIQKVNEVSHQKGIDSIVKTLGWVSGDKKSDLLKEAAIYVLPSYAEGLPMSVLEAMAAEAAVITTPVGGIPEAITNDVEGILIKPGDVQQLARALDRLLSDTALRHSFAAAGRKKVERLFSTKHVNVQMECLYQELGASR